MHGTHLHFFDSDWACGTRQNSLRASLSPLACLSWDVSEQVSRDLAQPTTISAEVVRALCPACAYDLRGSPTSGTCPECGSPYRKLAVDPDRIDAIIAKHTPGWSRLWRFPDTAGRRSSILGWIPFFVLFVIVWIGLLGAIYFGSKFGTGVREHRPGKPFWYILHPTWFYGTFWSVLSSLWVAQWMAWSAVALVVVRGLLRWRGEKRLTSVYGDSIAWPALSGSGRTSGRAGRPLYVRIVSREATVGVPVLLWPAVPAVFVWEVINYANPIGGGWCGTCASWRFLRFGSFDRYQVWCLVAYMLLMTAVTLLRYRRIRRLFDDVRRALVDTSSLSHAS